MGKTAAPTAKEGRHRNGQDAETMATARARGRADGLGFCAVLARIRIYAAVYPHTVWHLGIIVSMIAIVLQKSARHLAIVGMLLNATTLVPTGIFLLLDTSLSLL